MSSPLDTIYTGATLDFLVETLVDYPAGAGWFLRLVLNPRAGGAVHTIDSVADGDAHRLQASAATTGGWAAGVYGRQVWVLKGAEQYPVTDLFGQTLVRPGLAAPAGTDTRSDAERALAAIEATLAGKASAAVQSYQINGRSLSSYPLADLIRLRELYRREVAAERRAAGLQDGRGALRRIAVRLR